MQINPERIPKTEANVYTLTLATGASSAEPMSCTYTIEGNLCIVNLAAVTKATSGDIAINLPPAKTRSNITILDGGGGVVIIYIDPNMGIMYMTSPVTNLYTEFVYIMA